MRASDKPLAWLHGEVKTPPFSQAARIRAGYLLASLLSSMPAWTFVDPLPILDHFNDPNDPEGRRRRGGSSDKSTDDDHESLQSLVSQKTASSASGAQGELS